MSSQPSPTSFPRFNDLPIELRLMIWEVALEPYHPSIVPLHVHTHLIKGHDDSPDSTPFQAEIRWINECTQSCECMFSFLSQRAYPLTLPSPLFVCRESRAVAQRSYGVHFDQIYESATSRPWKSPQQLNELQSRLRDFFPPDLELRLGLEPRFDGTRNIETSHNDNNGARVTKFLKRGFFANPSVDHFGISVDLTMKRGMERLDQFIAIAEHEVAFASRIQTFLIQFVLGNRPYVWRWWRDGEPRKRPGADASWVRAKQLIKFERLKEVVVIICGRIPPTALPREWRTWKVQQWREELMKLEAEWPARWRGVTPKLTFKSLDFTVLDTDTRPIIV